MELRVWNRAKKDLRPDPYFSGTDLSECGFYFETCLRRLWIDIGSGRDRHCAADHVGIESYGFLLQVLCGLDSPFLAETEVLGQFREQSRKAPRIFSATFQRLYQDVKMIRSQFLTGIGSVSYGGISRALLKESPSVALIGAGSLGQEIAIWLAKEASTLSWYARSARSANGQVIHPWQSQIVQPGTSLVIAAPVAVGDLAQLPKLNRVLDFRPGEVYSGAAEEIFTFERLKQIAEENRHGHEYRLQQALRQIEEISRERFLESKARPFGWEDLCG